MFNHYLVGRNEKRELRILNCHEDYYQELQTAPKKVKKDLEGVIEQKIIGPALVLIVNNTTKLSSTPKSVA